MTPSPQFPVVVFNPLAIFLIIGICSTKILAQEGTSLTEIHRESSLNSESDIELPGNRVLPVDAEHNSKITFPQQSLDPICVQSLRENLVKFLKRVRLPRQDDGDDGDDGDGEGGGGGLLSGIGGGNGALAAFGQFPSFLPQFVSTINQISGAVNQQLNGTDTPDLPSFLVKQGQQFIKALVASRTNKAPSRPSAVHVERVPGSGGETRPSSGYDKYPEDYIDEVVEQPLQPTLRPGPVDFEGPRQDPYPGNPYLGNAGIPTTDKPQITNVETLNGLPPKTSLWQIYKSFRNRSPVNGSLSEFQLQHADAFSNELLHSISMSISNIRGQAPNPSMAISTAKPSPEISNQDNPAAEQPQLASIFTNAKRPTLSVYKPATVVSGVGVELANLASINKFVSQSQSNTLTSGEQQPPEEENLNPARPDGQLPQKPFIFSNQKRPTLSIYKSATVTSGVGVELSNLASLNKFGTHSPSQSNILTSGEHEQPEEEVNIAPSIQQELELDSVASLGVAKPKPDGSGGIAGMNGKLPAYKIRNSVATTGSLAQLNAQQNQGGNKLKPQFVKPTTSSLFAEYVPAVSSLHEMEDDQLQIVGPQATATGQNNFNGFNNLSPYKPVKGVLLDAPRLTPSPLFDVKPPSNLNLHIDETTHLETTSSFPEFSFQSFNAPPGSGATGLFPPGAKDPPVDPNPPRAPVVISAIAPNFHQYQTQKSPQINAALPPSLVPQNKDKFPQSEAIGSSIGTSTEVSQQESEPGQPEQDILSPGTNEPTFSLSSPVKNLVQPPVSPEGSQTAPERDNEGVPGSGFASTVSPIPNPSTKLLLYLLTNLHTLLGLNTNPKLDEFTNGSISASETSIDITTVTQIQEDILTSTLASFPAPSETPTGNPQVQNNLVAPQVPNIASSLMPDPVETPRPEVQNRVVAPHFTFLTSPAEPPRPEIQNNLRAQQAPTLAPLLLPSPPERPIPSPQPQNNLVAPVFPNSVPLLSPEIQPSHLAPPLIATDQQPGSINSHVFPTNWGNPILASENDTQIDRESTTTRSFSSLLTFGNYLAPFQFPSAPVQTNLGEVSRNKPSQTVEPTYESTEEPPRTIISVVTSISVVSGSESTEESSSKPVDSTEFPSLSHLYGNPFPAKLHENVAPIATSTSGPFAPLNGPYQSSQHLGSIPASIDGHGLPGSGSFVPPLPPPLSKPVSGGSSIKRPGPAQIGRHPALFPSTLVLSASSGLEASSGDASPLDKGDQRRPGSFSAISKMSNLPFFHENSFRPSVVLPPYLVKGNGDSYERRKPVAAKPMSELIPSQAIASTENPSVIPVDRGNSTMVRSTTFSTTPTER